MVDVVVVGGSAAGLTAAITCRRHYPDKSVLLIRKEQQALVPCGIPYIFGTLGRTGKDFMSDDVLEVNGIDLLVDEVTSIDRDEHVVTTKNGGKVLYDKMILATGSVPVYPEIPGIDMKNIFFISKDASYLRRMLDQLDRTSDLAIIGGGFIGMEFADECRKGRDINITIVEMLPHCLMLNFDKEFYSVAEELAKGNGISILAPDRVESFIGNGSVSSVALSHGHLLKADMVIVSVGCAENIALAQDADLDIGPKNGIQINRYMQTSDEDIYACGDCTEKISFFDGQISNLKLASIATREARIAGANLFDIKRINEGVIPVYSTVLSDTAALAGLSEREAKQKGYETAIGEFQAPNRHPGGMPDVSSLKVKLVFEKPTGILLGGQVMGAKCAGELINTISACVHDKRTANSIALFSMGTHPALTASPIAYQLTNAAEMAIKAMRLT